MRSEETKEIWIWVHSREGAIEEVTLGLASEARRLFLESGRPGKITALALGLVGEEELLGLGTYGVDRVLWISPEGLEFFSGEGIMATLIPLLQEQKPACFFMGHSPESEDLAPRLAAGLETGLVTRVVDLKVDEQGNRFAIRPIANGHLFEKVYLGQAPHILTFLPSVLTAEEIPVPLSPVIEKTTLIPTKGQTRLLERQTSTPEVLDLEEADIIIAGGRGMGQEEGLSLLRKLAQALGGTVAGTRPLIDWKVLPFEKQIGQTGKTVSPQLIITCGISGANEFTVGMEKSKLVIAINTDPQARIFRFADLGVVGDVHQVLPLLIEKLAEISSKVGDKKQEEGFK